MSERAGSTATADVGRQRTSSGASLTALQCELRQLFRSRPTNRALAEALQRIGSRLDAVYAVVHTRLGVHVLSEEWCVDEQAISTDARERINQALWESVSSEEARCTRLGKDDPSLTLATVVMYDLGAEPSGGAAIVLRDCDRQRALLVMVQLEAILGYLSVLLDNGGREQRRTAERRELRHNGEADHPVRLAYAILADLETRYGLELAAVGFVKRNRVQVVAVSGIDEPRAANPGVARIRSAMEECLDRGAPIVYLGRSATEGDNCRLHAQWSNHAEGNAVASFPLVSVGETVAIVSVSQGGGARLSREQVVLMAEELSGYAPLVPLSLAANRTVLGHLGHEFRRWFRRVAARGPLRAALLATALLLGGFWLLFGTMHHTFTVPCVVKASERRTIACPRSGVLAELFVRPGDKVRSGQLLAAIDASEDFLKRAELTAEIESLAALVDQAVAAREAGAVRVHQAQKRSLEAQLAIVDQSIAQAQIRAPHDGLILDGDLRERLGSRLELGTALFQLARYDRASVELRIPEQHLLAAGDCLEAQFSPVAQPDQRCQLGRLTIAPASTIFEQRNVFLAEAEVDLDLGLLPPGVEGTVHVDAGPRSTWWVLTHRVTDWLHLHFWL